MSPWGTILMKHLNQQERVFEAGWLMITACVFVGCVRSGGDEMWTRLQDPTLSSSLVGLLRRLEPATLMLSTSVD